MKAAPNGKAILYVGGFELPDKNAAAHRVVANAKIFSELGYEVLLLGINREGGSATIREDFDLELPGVRQWSVPYPQSNRQWLKNMVMANGVKALVDHYGTNISTIVCYNYPAIAMLGVKKICKTNGTAFVSDSTEWYNGKSSGLIKSIAKKLDTTLRMKIVNKAADGLIVTSHYLDNYYSKHGMKTVNLPTLYDKQALLTGNANTPCKTDSVTRLVYAGNPFPPFIRSNTVELVKERLDLVIDYLSKCKTNKFLLEIIGLTKERYLEVYPGHRQVLDDMNSQILFLGRRKHKEVVEKIISADFTIFLRDTTRVTQAGFPSKFSESITCGTPVITNKMSNIDIYSLEGQGCFYVPIDSAPNAAKKLNELLSMPAAQRADLKSKCADLMTFDYRSFVGEVGRFLSNIEGDARQ